MIEHALAVVTGRDIDSARERCERLFDRRPDNTPMASLVEWRVASAAWLQVTVDPSVYYENGTVARAAGATDIRIGEPGFGPKLDGNSDGDACES